MVIASFDETEFRKDFENLEGKNKTEYAHELMKKLYQDKRKEIVQARDYIEPGVEIANALKQLSIQETEESYQNISVLGLMKLIKKKELNPDEIKSRIIEFLPLADDKSALKDKISNLNYDDNEHVLQFINQYYLDEEYKSLGFKIINNTEFDDDDLAKFPLGNFNDLSFTLKISSVSQMLEFVKATHGYLKELVNLRKKFEKENNNVSKQQQNTQLVHLFLGPLR